MRLVDFIAIAVLVIAWGLWERLAQWLGWLLGTTDMERRARREARHFRRIR